MKASHTRKRAKRKQMGEKILRAKEPRIRDVWLTRHNTPNYARSFFRVCVTPAGYGLAIARPGRACTNIYVCSTSKIRRCRYRPLENHLARVATYGIMEVRAERGEELGERARRGSEGGQGGGPERREWKEVISQM